MLLDRLRAGRGPQALADAGLVFVAAVAVYWTGLALHAGRLFPQSHWPYFTYYARALLDGKLHFTVVPPAVLDLAWFQGHWYMHFPPFPALVLLPFVGLFGLGVPDRFVCVLLGAANGALLVLLLAQLAEAGLVALARRERLLLSSFFLLGTVHFYLAVTSNPWELAHVTCNTLLLSAGLLALARRWGLVAVALVAVLFTRTHVVLALPAFVGLYLWRESAAGTSRRRMLLDLGRCAAILAAGAAALLAFNYLRFGDVLENGVAYHAMHPLFRARFARYGYFDLAYVARNVNALLFGLPVPSDQFPFFSFHQRGLSLFLASPLYVYALKSLLAPQRRTVALLWASFLLPLIPVLLLMGTGEHQFGHRYSSDFQIFLVLLTALGLRGRFDRVAMGLLAASVAMNAYGTYWFLTR